MLIASRDGITEAAEAEGRELRERGVLDVVRRYPNARARDRADEVREAAGRFAGHAWAGDDRTVMVVRSTDRQESPVFHAGANRATRLGR